MKIGIQLYTIREEVEKDIRAALGNIASAGFEGVEFAFNYGGLAPDEVASLLAETGLECTGIYTDISQAASAGSEAYRYAEALGSPYLTLGLQGMVGEKEWPGAVERIEQAAAVAADRGKTLLYHNHWQELSKINGKPALDILFDGTSAGKVEFELDTGWIRKAGFDPVEYIGRFAGRLPCVHIRDFNPDFEVSIIGEGIVDIPAALAASSRAGVRWIVLEQSLGTFQSVSENFRKLSDLTSREAGC